MQEAEAKNITNDSFNIANSNEGQGVKAPNYYNNAKVEIIYNPFYISHAYKVVDDKNFGQIEELVGHQILCEIDDRFSMDFDTESEDKMNELISIMNSYFNKGAEYCFNLILASIKK